MNQVVPKGKVAEVSSNECIAVLHYKESNSGNNCSFILLVCHC